MNTDIGVDVAKLAGLQINLLQKIRSGHVTLDHLKWFNDLTKEDRDQLIFGKVFKTIKLGTGLKTADGFRKSLEDNGIKVSSWTNDILGKSTFTVATKEVEIDLVVRSVAELGFKDGATRHQIYNRANEFGLDLCPAEVGPQLRLQYKDQPNGEWLIVAMNPIAGSNGDLRLFGIGRGDSDLLLDSCYDGPVGVWSAGDRFVFARRK